MKDHEIARGGIVDASTLAMIGDDTPELIIPLNKIEIKASGCVGRIFVDGKELRRVTAVRYEHKAGNIPEVTISLLPDELIIESDCANVNDEVAE